MEERRNAIRSKAELIVAFKASHPQYSPSDITKILHKRGGAPDRGGRACAGIVETALKRQDEYGTSALSQPQVPRSSVVLPGAVEVDLQDGCFDSVFEETRRTLLTKEWRGKGGTVPENLKKGYSSRSMRRFSGGESAFKTRHVEYSNFRRAEAKKDFRNAVSLAAGLMGLETLRRDEGLHDHAEFL